VGGGVHLDHVDMAAFHDRLAVLAELVHVDGRLVDLAGDGIVERAGEDAGGGRLADAAHAGQHVGLRDAAGRNALVSVRTIGSWPIRSAKLCGRYLRASTR
jgi:hypothetical protein